MYRLATDGRRARGTDRKAAAIDFMRAAIVLLSKRQLVESEKFWGATIPVGEGNRPPQAITQQLRALISFAVAAGAPAHSAKPGIEISRNVDAVITAGIQQPLRFFTPNLHAEPRANSRDVSLNPIRPLLYAGDVFAR